MVMTHFLFNYENLLIVGFLTVPHLLGLGKLENGANEHWNSKFNIDPYGDLFSGATPSRDWPLK